MAAFHRAWRLSLVALVLVGCSGDLSQPELPPVRFSMDDCDPEFAFEDCEPDPVGWGGDARVGYNLGSSYSWQNCWNGAPDGDSDGLKDACELELANAFAPELNVHSEEECAGREPYFAARITDTWYKEVRIFYALAYYIDCGSDGHAGDSEFLAVTLLAGDGGVWVLDAMFTSAHYGAFGGAGDRSKWTFWTDIFWVDVEGGRPKVVVSKNKHANYRSVGACVDTWPTDKCEWGNTRSLRPSGQPFSHSANLGSSSSPLVDCVGSRSYPEVQRGTECFWSWDRFAGWFFPRPSEGSSSTGYMHLLEDLGM